MTTPSIDFCGHIVDSSGVRPEHDKVAAISKWPVPKAKAEVASFLGLLNFYRRFIYGYGMLTQILYSLTPPAAEWQWTAEHNQAFENCKQAMSTAPVLGQFVSGRETVLWTDASQFAYGGVLLQRDPVDHKLHPCAFESKAFKGATLNWDVRDKELEAICGCIKLWSHYLRARPFTVFTDHKHWRR